MQFTPGRLAIVGRRIASLVTRGRSQVVRKYHHPSDAARDKRKDQPGYDNLAAVAPMLKSMGMMCKQSIKSPGRDKSGDEETITFQGPHAELKQNCSKFKAAGDGLQPEAVCLHGGWLSAFAIRGHSLLPKVSVKARLDIKLSELHQRVVWVWYKAGITAGSRIGLDNLYNSVRFSWLFEAGATFLIEVPAGWAADVDYDGNEAARVIEWAIKDVHILGTLRGGRGSEAAPRLQEAAL